MSENVIFNPHKIANDVLQIAARRRWWIMLVTAASIVCTIVLMSVLPSRYTSEATLLVVQQQVPERFVLPSNTAGIREILQATTEEILSRTRLLEIVEEFDLYSKQRRRLSAESVLALIRHDIEIQPLESGSNDRQLNSFKISFTAESSQLAHDVTSRLTSLFISQNQETRERQATTTTKFLHAQLETAKTKLAAAEEEVRGFKMQHLGALPEQEQGNLAILAGLQSQLQSTMASLNRAQEQGQYLESLARYRSISLENELTSLESQKAALLERYTPAYPAATKLTKRIEQLQALMTMLQTPSAIGQGDSSHDTLIANTQDFEVGQLRSQMEENKLEIANLIKDERQLQTSIARYQSAINEAPVLDQQLAGILRNYELLKQEYADLLSKEMQSQLSADLEKQQEGQQFRIVDLPSLPTVPTTPKRFKIGVLGTLGGLVLGIAVAFLLELMDRSFHSEDDLIQRMGVPLVISIPRLLTPEEERFRLLRNKLEWALGSTLAFGLLVTGMYEFYLSRHGF